MTGGRQNIVETLLSTFYFGTLAIQKDALIIASVYFIIQQFEVQMTAIFHERSFIIGVYLCVFIRYASVLV